MVTFAAETENTPSFPTRAPAQCRVSHFVAISCSVPSDSRDLYNTDCRTHARLVSPSRDPIGYAAGVGLSVYCRSTPTIYVDPSGFQSAYPPGSQWCSPRLVGGSPQSASNRFIVRSQTQIFGMDVSRLRVDGRIFATNGGWDAGVHGYAVEWLLLAVRTDSFSIYPSGNIICTESKQGCLASYGTNGQDSLDDGFLALGFQGKVTTPGGALDTITIDFSFGGATHSTATFGAGVGPISVSLSFAGSGLSSTKGLATYTWKCVGCGSF